MNNTYTIKTIYQNKTKDMEFNRTEATHSVKRKSGSGRKP